MDRRSFLRRTMYFAVVAASAGLSACNDGGNGDEEAEVSSSYGFPLGVASGDPRAESVVFWSRCLPRDGSGSDVALRLPCQGHCVCLTQPPVRAAQPPSAFVE